MKLQTCEDFMEACLEEDNYWVSRWEISTGLNSFSICFDYDEITSYWLFMGSIGLHEIKSLSEEELKCRIEEVKQCARQTKNEILGRIKEPNQETLDAIAEPPVKSYDTIDQMFEHSLGE